MGMREMGHMTRRVSPLGEYQSIRRRVGGSTSCSIFPISGGGGADEAPGRIPPPPKEGVCASAYPAPPCLANIKAPN